MRNKFAAAAILVAFLTGTVLAARGSSTDVRTIAGSGRPGMTDGPDLQATFLMPAGIAVAPDGTIYVADQAAQRIRSISNGVVTTVAGSGDLTPDKLGVEGGYLEGPGLQAKFNLPSGLAMGPDGALYIADSKNRCIRKLDHGLVSHAVGSCGYFDTPIAFDGRAESMDTQFIDPRAIAFDRGGNAYIADFGGGLRLLTKAHSGPYQYANLVTIKLKGSKSALGVAVAPDDTVVVTTLDQIIVYHPGTQAEEDYSINANEGGYPFGVPDAIAAISNREYVFADPASETLRYLRLPAPPYVNTLFTRTISGGTLERASDNGDFRDGERAAARFFSPSAIAIAGNIAYVADASNRRIRRLVLPPTAVSEAGTSGAVSADSRHADIAYVGSISSFYDSLRDDSICGRVEADLNASHRSNLPVRCHAVRIDGGTIPAMQAYIRKFLAPQPFKTIVWQISPQADAVPAQAAFKSALASIAAALKPHHTKLVLVWMYTGAVINGPENFGYRERALRESPTDEVIYHARTVVPALKAAISLQIPQIDLYADMLRYEAAPIAPLFNTNGDGLTQTGRAFVGKHVGDFLLARHAF